MRDPSGRVAIVLGDVSGVNLGSALQTGKSTECSNRDFVVLDLQTARASWGADNVIQIDISTDGTNGLAFVARVVPLRSNLSGSVPFLPTERGTVVINGDRISAQIRERSVLTVEEARRRSKDGGED